MDGTNKLFLTADDIFAMQGREVGFAPSDAELADARALAKTLNLDKVKQWNAASNPTNIAAAGVLTNEVTKEEYPVAKDAMGRILSIIKPDILNTGSGFQYISGPGRTRDFINEDTGETPKGYAAMGFFDDDGATVGGPYMPRRPGQTNAPTPAPQGISVTNSNGIVMTFTNAAQVKQAFQSKIIGREEARQAVIQFEKASRAASQQSNQTGP
jgi:hypothetical protein